MQTSKLLRFSAARIAWGYAVIASLWIAFSDAVFTHMGATPVLLTLKGVGFVAVTACLLFLTIRRLVETVRHTARERDENAQLYRTVVNSSQEGICLLDSAGRISFSNARVAAMLDQTIEDIQGHHVREFFDIPELLLHYSPQDAKLRRTYEYQLQTKSGQNLWVLVSSTSLFDHDGTLCGFLVMFVDMTECKRLETELQQSQKLEALGTFAGAITHDFNNLLSIMTGYGSLLENALPRESREAKAAREILNACHRGTLLIRQLLAFSRKQVIAPEVVEACEIVSRFAEVLPRIVGEHIAVDVQCDSSTGFVQIGAGQIEQTLMNLAANARDAMPSGGTLTVRTSTVEIAADIANAQGVEPGRYVLIQVSDTGVGMDAETRSRVFEPFFTTKPQGTGTGLGLSTVSGIAAQNHGFVTCDTTLGGGTTFGLYLPLAQPRGVVLEFPKGAPRTLIGNETVLLVEDEPALRAMTSQILSSNGYNVIEAADGNEAIHLMKERHPHVDLLLTDIVMPGISGVELAQKLSILLPGMQIAFMSGYSDIPNSFDGNAHRIEKPIAPDALLLKIRTIFDQRSSA